MRVQKGVQKGVRKGVHKGSRKGSRRVPNGAPAGGQGWESTFCTDPSFLAFATGWVRTMYTIHRFQKKKTEVACKRGPIALPLPIWRNSSPCYMLTNDDLHRPIRFSWSASGQAIHTKRAYPSFCNMK